MMMFSPSAKPRTTKKSSTATSPASGDGAKPAQKAPRTSPSVRPGAPKKPGVSAQRRSYAECFQAFIAEARALPDEAVTVFRADAQIALANVRAGVDGVCADPEAVREHLPRAPLARVLELPDLVRAVIYAGTRVRSGPASDGEIQRRLEAIRVPRQEMLDNAASLARRGLFDAEAVASVREGSGPHDMARDGVSLHALYTDPAVAPKIKGLHPFTDAELEALRADSEWLLEHLKPQGGRRPRKERRHTPEDDRDRLWSLVLRDHAWLRRIGHYFHGDAIDQHVPKLQSRVHAPSAIDDEEHPTEPTEPHNEDDG